MKQHILLQGGLANQMFQYAFYLSLRQARGDRYVLNSSIYGLWRIHNGYELRTVFGIDDKLVRYRSALGRKWMRYLFLHEPHWAVCKDPGYVVYEKAYHSRKKYLLGYWLNAGYFSPIADTVRQAFVFQDIDDANLGIASEMHCVNSVSIHVRRGDYLKHSGHFCTCGMDYYHEAVDYIKARVSDPVFFVFSDDVEWCRMNFPSLGVDFRIITCNKGKDSYKDMYLMTQCSHNIIANSTFSWWGAWLNENPDKIVIAPDRWFADIDNNISPDGWIRL